MSAQVSRPARQRENPTSAVPFARLPIDTTAQFLSDVYGINVTAPPVRLATERDDTFDVRSNASRFILKVAHPADDPAVIDLQTAVLAHIERTDGRLPVQKVLPTRNGLLHPAIHTADGTARLTRLLTYLDGEPLRHAHPTPAQLQACGQNQARLTRALESFDHVAAHRSMPFDLAAFHTLRDVTPLQDAARFDRLFEWFDHVLAPRADDLPAQTVHMDFSLDNILVDADSPDFVCGILDWGDVVHTWRVGDLAAGLAAHVPTTGDPWAHPTQMLRGYESVLSLTGLERELLPGMVALRIGQRALMAEKLSSEMSDNTAYLRRNVELSYRQLANLDF